MAAVIGWNIGLHRATQYRLPLIGPQFHLGLPAIGVANERCELTYLVDLRLGRFVSTKLLYKLRILFLT
jgi:hypothetical protein